MKRLFFFLAFVYATATSAQESAVLQQQMELTPQVKSVKAHLQDLMAKGLSIYYTCNHVDLEHPIRLVKENGTVNDLLRDILRDQPLQIVERKNKIYIFRVKVIPSPPKEIIGRPVENILSIRF